MPKQYRVMRADRAAMPVDAGATVYSCSFHDYGCARDDTNNTGIEHVSVTHDPEGGYPFFTIPEMDLAEVPK